MTSLANLAVRRPWRVVALAIALFAVAPPVVAEYAEADGTRRMEGKIASVDLDGESGDIAALVLEATFTAIFVPVLARAERDDPEHAETRVTELVKCLSVLGSIAGISLVILIATCVGAILVGAKIYQNSILRMGARVKLAEALRG